MKHFLYDTSPEHKSPLKEGLVSFSIKEKTALRFLTLKSPIGLP